MNNAGTIAKSGTKTFIEVLQSKKQVANTAFVEHVQNCSFDMVYMAESTDEYHVQQLKEFGGKTLVPITKEGLEKKMEESKAKSDTLCKLMKEILDKMKIR